MVIPLAGVTGKRAIMKQRITVKKGRWHELFRTDAGPADGGSVRRSQEEVCVGPAEGRR